MKKIIITFMVLFCIISSFAYDKELTMIEVGDDELMIGYFLLDTPAYNNYSSVTNVQSGGSGGLSTSNYKLPKTLVLDVLDDRYESGDNVFSTLELSIPTQLLSKGGVFEYSVVSPDGTEYEMKMIPIDNNKDKLLVYDLPLTAQDGLWTMKGQLKFDGYEPIKVNDEFEVRNYTMFIMYLLAITLITILALVMYLKRKKSKYDI